MKRLCNEWLEILILQAIGLASLLKCLVVHTRCSCLLSNIEMDSFTTILPKLKMTPEAVKKREYRRIEKERRETTFVHAYVQVKHPKIYEEAKEVYATIVNKYPGKPDLTKTYYFRKWRNEIMNKKKALMTPQLPILMPLPMLQQYQTSGHEAGSDVVNPTVEKQSQPPAVEMQFNQHVVLNPGDDGYPTAVQQTIEIQTSDSTQPARTQNDNLDVHQTVETRSDNLVSGLTLEEMALSVEEMVKALQSDTELMDLVESFDLPNSVWDNELAVPDYALESDLEW